MTRFFRRRQLWSRPVAGVAAIATCAGLGIALSAGSAGAARTQAATTTSTTSPAAVTGFWNGTDSNNMAIPGAAPYHTPAIGGYDGGYIGMIGNWAVYQHCSGTKVVWSTTDSNDARTNLLTYSKGIGVGVYWFMGGPGVDPHYNGTTHEAAVWGDAQAAYVLNHLQTGVPKPNYPVVFMDVELPGHAPSYTPAADNGWNSVYTSACSGKVKSGFVAASVDRAEFNAFANWLTSHSAYKVGVYSAPSIWASIFGTGSSASIPNTY